MIRRGHEAWTMRIVYVRGTVWYVASYNRTDELTLTDCEWIIPLAYPWNR